MDQDTKFLLKRAHDEAMLAIKADNEAASDAHQGLAIRYSARALVQLSREDEPKARADSPEPE